MPKKIFIISVILGIILTPCSFNFPEINNLYAQTEIHCGETISQSATWTASNSPYIISGDHHLRILPGVVLTIEPGVIVKFSENGGLAVNGGEIIAKGAEENPIIFTSNNGSSYPQSGGWSSIEVYNHGKITLDYAVVEYGGFIQHYERLDNKIFKPNTALAQDYYYDNFTGAITISGAQANINNSIINNNTIGLKIMDIGDPDYSGYPAYATSTVSIHNSKIYNNDRYGVFNGGASQVDAINNWWGDDSGPRHYSNPAGTGDVISGDVLFDPWIGNEEKKDPVIIVPGIMGSWNVSGRWELDPILHTYDNLWEALKSAGYEENKTLFAFPYQWRLSNSYTALLLKDKIQEVKNICQCDRVDLITHSMGGLVARAYIQSNDYGDDVDQLIFLGTPHKGSTKAYLTWEGGELGQTSRDFIFERIFAVEADFNGYGSVFKYIRGLPMQSVQELLPIYDYLRDKGTMQLRAYPNNYPANTFLELLNNQSQLEKLNNINITNILADAGSDGTINNLRVVEKEFVDGEWEHGYPEHYSLPFTDHGLEYDAGDGTVPERSNKDFAGLENVVINSSSHNNMVTDAQKTVIKTLTGIEPTQEIKKNIFSKFLLIRIFSPADFTVIAPNGSKIGKNIGDSATIESAFYSGLDSDIEFAVIPDPIDGEYKIELEGTGEGEYKLSVSYIDDEQDVDKDFVGKIQTGQTRDFTIIYSEQAEENPISDLATINSTIADIEEMYNKGWIIKKSDKNLLIYRLKYLEKRLEHFDKQIENIEKLIQQAQDNEKLKPKAKEKILQALNKRIEEIAKQRQKAIERNLDWLERKLNAMETRGVINQNGYDVIISDINYLRNNL